MEIWAGDTHVGVIPGGGDCKEMVRNKETFSVNGLVSSMVYYPVFSVFTSVISSYG